MKHVRILISRASYSMVLLISIATLLDHAMGQTKCIRVASGYSLSVASLCYKTRVSAGRVVLDGFLTYNSSISVCSCSLTSTQSTRVSFTPLNSLQPNYIGCDSSLRIQNGGTVFSINCFVSRTIAMSPLDTATLSFERPSFGYDSDYCMLLTPDNSNAMLTLSCDGDLNFPSTAKTPAPTTQRSTTQPVTTTTAKTTLTMTTSANAKTNLQFTTVSGSDTSNIATTNYFMNASLKTTRTKITPTTKISSQENSTTTEWSYTIPAIGAGSVLTVAIILAVWYSHRKVRKKTDKNEYDVIDLDNQLNLPYSRDYVDVSNRTGHTSISANVYDTIDNVDYVRNEASVTVTADERNFPSYSERVRFNVPVNTSLDDNDMYLTPAKMTVEKKQMT